MAGIFPNGGVAPSQALNTLPSARIAAGCASLWHSTSRCTPKFDPAAANAVMSELLNFVNLCRSADGTWDCNRLDNMARAIGCIIEQTLTDCLTITFPTDAGACQIEQLVLMRDSTGYRRIARHSESASIIGGGSACNVYNPGFSGSVPPDPSDPTTYYSREQLSQAQLNNTIDEARLVGSLLWQGTINVPCDGTRVRIELNNGVIFNPAANGGNGQISSIVVRVDGEFNVESSGFIAGHARTTNYDSFTSDDAFFTLDAGVHNVQGYLVAEQTSPGLPPVPFGVGCNATSTSSSGGFAARIDF